MKTTLLASDVIDAFVNASNAAYRAHATRKLNAYVKQQVKLGYGDVATRAAIKAHVTRRKAA